MTAAQILTAALTATSPAQADAGALEQKPAVVESVTGFPSATMGQNFREMTASEVAQMQQQQSSGAAAADTTKGSISSGQSQAQGAGPDPLQAENSTLHKLMLKLDPALVDQVQGDNNAQLKIIGRLMSGPGALANEADPAAANAALRKVIASPLFTPAAIDGAMTAAGLTVSEVRVVDQARGNSSFTVDPAGQTESTQSTAVTPIAVSKEQRARENMLLAGLASDVVKDLSKEERQAYNDKPEWDAVEKAGNYGKLEKLKQEEVDRHYAEITKIVKDLDEKHPERVNAALDARQGGEQESLRYLMVQNNIRSREIALDRQEQKNERAEQERQQDADRHRQRMETIDQKQQQDKIKGNLKLFKEGLRTLGTARKILGF